jgi:hypothetical protein
MPFERPRELLPRAGVDTFFSTVLSPLTAEGISRNNPNPGSTTADTADAGPMNPGARFRDGSRKGERRHP